LTLPAAVGAPTHLSLLTTTRSRGFAVHAAARGLALAPRAAHPTLRRHGSSLSISGLGAQVTGVVVRLSTGARSLGGEVQARVASAAGAAVQVLNARTT
jgi:hypothetical protein